MLLKFRAVVGQDEREREREDRLAEGEEICGCKRSVGRGCERKPETGIHVDEGDDVSSRSVNVLLKGIERDHVAGVQSLQSLGFPERRDAHERLHASRAGDAERHHPEASEVAYKAADGLGLRT